MMKLTTLTAAALFAAVSLCADDHSAKKEDCAKQDCKPQKCCCCCCHNLKGKTVKICPMPGAQNQQNTPGVMQITEGEMVIYAIPVNSQANAAQTPAQNAPAAATAQNTPAPAGN